MITSYANTLRIRRRKRRRVQMSSFAATDFAMLTRQSPEDHAELFEEDLNDQNSHEAVALSV